jgi:predicted DNA-binding transcriptional regulator AlpA
MKISASSSALVARLSAVTGDTVSSINAVHDLVGRIEAAELLGVSPRTLDRWHLMRVGPARIKMRGLVRYRLSAISDWLRSCETVGPHEP